MIADRSSICVFDESVGRMELAGGLDLSAEGEDNPVNIFLPLME